MKRSAATPSVPEQKVKPLQCYKDSYKNDWPFIEPSPVSKNHAFCKTCFSHFSIGHGGRHDCRRHVESARHKKSSKMSKYKTKKFLSLEEKICVLERLKKGEGSTQIANSVGVNESTVRYIRKTEQELMKRVAKKSLVSAKKTTAKPTACHARDPIMKEMEQSLNVWIEENIQKQIALNPSMIQEKALNIYQLLRESNVYDSKQHAFRASKSWYERFKIRFNFHDLKVSEGIVSDNAAAESHISFHQNSAKDVPDELTNIIHGLGYSTDQILNPGETVLYWKQVPEIKNEFEATENKNTLTVPSISKSMNIDSDHERSCEPNTSFNFKTVKEGLKLAYKLECFFIGNDPSMSRSLKFKKELKKALAPYKEIYRESQVKNGH